MICPLETLGFQGKKPKDLKMDKLGGILSR